MIVAAWEAYKEIAAVLGVVALVMAVWKRRVIVRFAWAVLAGHWGMAQALVESLRKSGAEMGRIKKVWLMPLVVSYLVLKAMVVLPKIVRFEIEFLRTAIRGYREAVYWRKAAERWAEEIQFGRDFRRWWKEE